MPRAFKHDSINRINIHALKSVDWVRLGSIDFCQLKFRSTPFDWLSRVHINSENWKQWTPNENAAGVQIKHEKSKDNCKSDTTVVYLNWKQYFDWPNQPSSGFRCY